MKKYSAIFIIIFCIFAILSNDRIINFIDKEINTNRIYNYLLSKKLVKKCYEPGNVTYPDFFHYFEQQGYDYHKVNDEIIAKSLTKIDQVKNQVFDPRAPTIIPLISHRVYFTDSDNSKPLNDFYVAMLKNSYQKLNSYGVWRHIFWTNKPSLVPEDLIKKYNIELRFIEEFKDEKIFNTLKDTIVNGKNFKGNYAQASDILRVLAVKKYGGIYTDLDYEFYNPELLVKFLQNFTYLGAKDDNGFYVNGFIAAIPNHPILNKAAKLLDKNYSLDKTTKLPDNVLYPCTRYQKIFISGPPLITIAYFKENNKNPAYNDVILPSWVSLNFDLARFKNKTCNYNEITKSFLQDSNDRLNKIIQDFILEFKQVDSINGYNKNRQFRPEENNIFYNLDFRNNYQIIGADMGCGNWSTNSTGNRMILYWNFFN